MPALTNTVQTFSMVGIREDLSDVIMNIAPTETPFYSMCRKGKCTNRNPEWERDTLAAPNGQNKVVEGNDITQGDSTAQPDRLRNYVQLFNKVVFTSDTANAVDSAGKSTELKYQVAKKGKELKRDIETRICGNYGSTAGNSSTAGEMAGAEAWIVTNAVRGTGGASGGFNTGTQLVGAATDGTLAALTEANFKAAIKSAWDQGGEPETVMVTGKQKQKISSTFTGIATQYNQVNEQNKLMIYGASDVYKSDFGQHKIIPNRFMGGSGTRSTNAANLYDGVTALVLTPNVWELKFLQAMETLPLARTGNAEKRLLKCEFTLACKEERANAVVADLN